MRVLSVSPPKKGAVGGSWRRVAPAHRQNPNVSVYSWWISAMR
jgi:hypothetical protein